MSQNSTDASKHFIVAGNWKMHPNTLKEAKDIFLPLKDGLRSVRDIETIVCPPAPFLAPLKEIYKGKKIALGAQDSSLFVDGSHTGEIGATMVSSVGAEYVILGHSERRAAGETNEDVKEKMGLAIKAGLTPIVCIGEEERDEAGGYLDVLSAQIHDVFYGTSRDHFERVVVAYEPIWAIGKTARESVSPHALHETAIYIRKILSGLFSQKSAFLTPILYGGSVEPRNAGELIDGTGVEGFLVGHASLVPDDFLSIIKTVDSYAGGL